MRLRAPVEMGAWVCWSQFSRVTGNVLWDLPPGLRQAVSGAQVATLYHTSLSASEDLWTAVDASDFLSQNIHVHTVKPSFYFNISCCR